MEHPPLSANSEKKMPASKRTSVVGNRSHAKAQASGGSCLVTRKVTTVERSAEKALLSIGLSEENDEENQKWSDDTQFVSSQTAFFPKTRFNFLKQLAHYMDTDGYTTAPEQQQVVLLPTPVESVISDCNFTRQLRSTVKVQPNAKISPYLPYQPLFSETTTNVRNNHFEEQNEQLGGISNNRIHASPAVVVISRRRFSSFRVKESTESSSNSRMEEEEEQKRIPEKKWSDQCFDKRRPRTVGIAGGCGGNGGGGGIGGAIHLPRGHSRGAGQLKSQPAEEEQLPERRKLFSFNVKEAAGVEWKEREESKSNARKSPQNAIDFPPPRPRINSISGGVISQHIQPSHDKENARQECLEQKKENRMFIKKSMLQGNNRFKILTNTFKQTLEKNYTISGQTTSTIACMAPKRIIPQVVPQLTITNGLIRRGSSAHQVQQSPREAKAFTELTNLLMKK